MDHIRLEQASTQAEAEQLGGHRCHQMGLSPCGLPTLGAWPPRVSSGGLPFDAGGLTPGPSIGLYLSAQPWPSLYRSCPLK